MKQEYFNNIAASHEIIIAKERDLKHLELCIFIYNNYGKLNIIHYLVYAKTLINDHPMNYWMNG